ncbi:MAG: hypothetical protein WDO13_02580 [Verrucomicrobiota bacterium]
MSSTNAAPERAGELFYKSTSGAGTNVFSKEIVSTTKISSAVGVVEVTAIASMLIGGLAGGALYDYCFATLGNAWLGAEMTMAVLTTLALFSLIAGYQIQRTPSHTNQPFRNRAALGALRTAQGRLARSSRSGSCVLGISYFYGLAGALYLTLYEVAYSVHPNYVGAASHTGVYAGHARGGHHRRQLPGHAHDDAPGRDRPDSHRLRGADLRHGPGPARWGRRPAGFLLALFGMGIAGALFVVPLNAHLQEQVEPERRGRILSANNLFVNPSSASSPC